MASSMVSIHRITLAAALALACTSALAAPPRASSHSGSSSASRGTWHGSSGNWHGPVPRYYARPYVNPFNPFYTLPLPPPPLYYDPSAYYPGYTPYGAYDPSGAYLPPQDTGPTTYIEQPNYVEQPPNYVTAPNAAAPQLPLEQRVQRLKAMCDQGLFTAEECAARRQELLNQM